MKGTRSWLNRTSRAVARTGRTTRTSPDTVDSSKAADATRASRTSSPDRAGSRAAAAIRASRASSPARAATRIIRRNEFHSPRANPGFGRGFYLRADSDESLVGSREELDPTYGRNATLLVRRARKAHGVLRF